MQFFVESMDENLEEKILIKKIYLRLFLTAFVVTILSACGGGSDGASTDDYSGFSSLTVEQAIIETNSFEAVSFIGYTTGLMGGPAYDLDPDSFYFSEGNVDYAKALSDYTSRWESNSVDVYIEAPLEGTYIQELSYTSIAIDNINSLLDSAGVDFLLNRVSVEPVDGSDYIHVSYGTSYYPQDGSDPQNYCANVSTGKYLGNMVTPYNSRTPTQNLFCGDVDPETCNSKKGLRSGTVYLNISGDHIEGLCASSDIIQHEFLHALGFDRHFDGFGFGSALSDTANQALIKIYSKPLATPFNDL
jgi:hypothetical protein